MIASGQSSTITGTLAGQIVMEGYLDLRIRPWLRRLITRLIAIIPAVACIIWFGEDSLGRLLVFSQVVLSLQLGFAVIPLIHFCSDRERMGVHVIPRWARLLAWLSAFIIVTLNARLVWQEVAGWISESGLGIAAILVLLGLAAALALLLYITGVPFVRRVRQAKGHLHEKAPALIIDGSRAYKHIAVTVDFGPNDQRTISAALAQGGREARYMLIHIVESAVARYRGPDSADHETMGDAANLRGYINELAGLGYTSDARIGFGHAPAAIAQLVNDSGCDLLVMGAHGHRGLKDLLLGATVDAVRHRVKVTVLIVQ